MNERIYCSERARAEGAPLYGTAVEVDLWLMIEYARPWRAKAVEENELPDAVREHLGALPAAVAAAGGGKLRVQFVKNGRSAHAAHPRVMLADCRGPRARLSLAELGAHADLAGLDPAVLAAGELPGGRRQSEGIYLVCTNGQRDLCCARFGLPLYERLSAAFEGRVWQTTHIGGHRYAPNLVCLPAGVVYGFVQPDEGVEVVQAFERGVVSLRHLRGHSHLPPVAQAAEYFLREAEGQHAADAYRLEGLRENGDTTHVTFVDAGGTHHELDVRVRRDGAPVVASCNAEPKALECYELVGGPVAQ